MNIRNLGKRSWGVAILVLTMLKEKTMSDLSMQGRMVHKGSTRVLQALVRGLKAATCASTLLAVFLLTPAVLVAQTEDGFAEPTLVVRDFGYDADAGEWRLDKHVRTLADVNGDGKADIVGFGDRGVIAALATDSGFAEPTLVVLNAGEWRIEQHIRTLADINGDGKADIVSFGVKGVTVALATDSGFTEPTLVVRNFGSNADAGEWRIEQHVRTLADVNGDGKADIVGFGDKGVIVALATDTGFAEPTLVVLDFAYDAGTWRLDKHVRTLADVNGDGKADIVGFGDKV